MDLYFSNDGLYYGKNNSIIGSIFWSWDLNMLITGQFFSIMDLYLSHNGLSYGKNGFIMGSTIWKRVFDVDYGLILFTLWNYVFAIMILFILYYGHILFP